MALSKIQTAEMLDAPNLGRRNLIINGAMQVWQRGISTSALTHNSNIYHSADRWSAVLDQDQGSGTLTTTFSQSTDVPSTEAFTYSLKAVVNASSRTPSGTDCTALFSHSIETYNANPLGWGTAAAKQATLSYWIKSSVAGTGTLQLRLNDSNQVNGVADSQLYTKFTINQANTWEKKTHIIPANATDGWRRNVSENAIQIYWFFGSNQAAAPTQDAWFRQNNYGQRHDDMTLSFQTTGGTAYITGCQLEVGNTATDFEHRSIGEELQLCQRYYQRLQRQETNGQDANSATFRNVANTYITMGHSHSSTICYAFWKMKTSMRDTPTLDYSSAGDIYINDGGTNRQVSAASIVNHPSLDGLLLSLTTTGLTSGEGVRVFLQATGDWIDFDSEI